MGEAITLHGRVPIVTGGARGLGRAMALALAKPAPASSPWT